MRGPSLQVVSTDPLTRREAQVLLWIAEGKTAWETGLILGVSESTVTAHAKSAMLKLDAATRPHLGRAGSSSASCASARRWACSSWRWRCW